MRTRYWIAPVLGSVLTVAAVGGALEAQPDRAAIDESGFVAIGGIDQFITPCRSSSIGTWRRCA